jgi:hypothetical protein
VEDREGVVSWVCSVGARAEAAGVLCCALLVLCAGGVLVRAVDYGEEYLIRCGAVLAVRLVLLYSVRALGCVSLPASFPL